MVCVRTHVISLATIVGTFLQFMYSNVCLHVHYTKCFQAKDAIKEAERCDPDSIFTQFMVYKIAVQDNNVKKGVHKNISSLIHIL